MYAQPNLPPYTAGDICNWVTGKGFDIICILQTIAQPLTVIIFILAAGMALIGALGNGSMSARGIWAMVVSVFTYTAVLYAPAILDVLVSFLGS